MLSFLAPCDTTEKKQLFSKLMRESPSFNHDNKDPDWKHAVQIWNLDHVDGKTIFYKVCSNALILYSIIIYMLHLAGRASDCILLCMANYSKSAYHRVTNKISKEEP